MNRWVAVVLVMGVAVSAYSQEYGRGALTVESTKSAGLGRAALPAATHDGYRTAGAWGVRLGVGWANADWDLGSASGSDSVLAPQAAWFFKTTDQLDVSLSTLFVSAEDKDSRLGATEADMARIALGLRLWIDTGSRFTPYLGGGLGYYLLEGEIESALDEDGNPVAVEDSSVEDAPGAYMEGGAAFQVSDSFYVTADLAYDFLVGNADAKINGVNQDFEMKSISANLCAAWMF